MIEGYTSTIYKYNLIDYYYQYVEQHEFDEKDSINTSGHSKRLTITHSCSNSHTPTAVSATQGNSELGGSSQGEVSYSGKP